ncbi:hypothetical protein PR202_ga30954 [Eleusine coracana subsp. coracana]|uniref:Uncharacterized protein n=1 Tax=Eleusine coracana subsp. coracana TaxID=191504 RepID=A0AAV5DNS1_ELECO|nr:hypothetical protein PR202_ga30954 [Eleusine coracana subsp. coracana]
MDSYESREINPQNPEKNFGKFSPGEMETLDESSKSEQRDWTTATTTHEDFSQEPKKLQPRTRSRESVLSWLERTAKQSTTARNRSERRRGRIYEWS